MKLSIIITCYNIEKYIERCINSILPQLIQETELIIINDGSTDKTLNILQKIIPNQPNIKIVSFDNGGPSTARNRGIKLSKGEYIWFIDGDDFIHENAIETLNRYIYEYNSPDIIAFNFRIKGFNDIQDSKIFNQSIQNNSGFISFGSFYVWNKIYKRKIFQLQLFEVGLRNIEDFVFNLSISPYISKILTIPDCLYIYERTNIGSISMNRKPRHLINLSNETFKAHDILLKRYKKLDDRKLKKVWNRFLNINYAGHIFSLLRFYNCNQVKRTIIQYKRMGVYPFKYTGNMKMKAFTFIINNKILWSVYPLLKRFISS